MAAPSDPLTRMAFGRQVRSSASPILRMPALEVGVTAPVTLAVLFEPTRNATLGVEAGLIERDCRVRSPREAPVTEPAKIRNAPETRN